MLLGTPTEKEWPGLKSLPDYFEFTNYPSNPLKSIFTAASPDALDLLDQLLNYNPLARPDAYTAISHAYFTNLPRPTKSDKLPKASFAAISSTKRKIDDLDEDGEAESANKLARKLF